MGTSVVFLEKDLGFAFALGFLIVFIIPGDVFVALGLGGSGAGAGGGASSCPSFGADFAIAFALGRGGADFFRGGPKVSGGPLAVGMEDGGSASAITSFCTDLPQPLPFEAFLPFSVWTIVGAGPSIPSGCFCAGDLVFGPTGFDLCRSLAIVLTFVGGDGS